MTRVRAVLVAVLLTGLTACTNAPTAPGGLGVEVAFSYRSIVLPSLPWPADVCEPSDPRPVLMMGRGNDGIPMEPDAVDPRVWGIRAAVPVNVMLSVSVRDPGLCRMPYPPYGHFAWSGLAVNSTTLAGVDPAGPDGRPCFSFRVGSDGDVLLQRPLDARR